MNRYDDLQQKVDETARTIYRLIGDEVPSLFDTGKWKGKIMEWAMREDAVKVPLFRFIDALPSVKKDDRVVSLLNEYFENVKESPFVIKRGLKSLSGSGILPRVAGRIIRSRVASFGRQFIAGKDPSDAENALQGLRRDGLAFTVDLLGEVVLSHKEAAVYQGRYLDLLETLGPKVRGWPEQPELDRDDTGPIPKLDISVKVSSFDCHLDPIHWEESIATATEGLSPVFAKARDMGSSVTVDMEHYYLKDLTIAIFKSLLDRHRDCDFTGIALQAYLPDTETDVLDLVEWAKSRGRRIAVRLVKGAYWDYETVINRQRGWPVPVLLSKEETDRNFDNITRILIENIDHVRPAIATHNIRSISHAAAVADSLGISRNALEFQVIYGMAEPVRSALKKMGFRVRVYTPVGELIPGMAYLIRRLLENTSNESFLRQTFFEERPTGDKGEPPAQKPYSEPIRQEEGFRNEPVLDFSKLQNRNKMRDALQDVANRFNERYPLILGSEEIWTENEIISINPAAREQVAGRVCSASTDHAETAVAESRRAWISWRKTPPAERAQYLFRTAQAMRAHRFQLAALEVHEVGKAWKEADADVTEAIDFLEYYGREMIELGSSARLGRYPGEKNLYLYEPRGVGVVISPWNFPLAIPVGMVSAGIVTGNCVIFKPSGLSSVLGWNIVRLFRDAGLPSGVLQFLPGPGDAVGEYLVSHPAVDFVSFTGSLEVGLKIVELAARATPGQRSIKRVVAELGGKNAIIVDETADIDEAVKGVLESAFGFQGQKCSACSRVIVVGDAFDEFRTRLEAAVDSIPVGPVEDPKNLMGPVIDQEALEKIRRYKSLARQEGRILYQGPGDLGGQYVAPLLVGNLPGESPILHQEIFGPVLAVIRCKDLNESLRIANSTVQALTGGIFSRSPANIKKAQQEFMVGNLYINRKITGALVGRQPFGGMGMSGVGSKTGGPDYLQQFMNARSVSENTLRRGFAPDE